MSDYPDDIAEARFNVALKQCLRKPLNEAERAILDDIRRDMAITPPDTLTR